MCVIIVTTGNQQNGGIGGRGWGKEPQTTILFLWDVNVTAGGHVDLSLPHSSYVL